jgi:hypothetical protein
MKDLARAILVIGLVGGIPIGCAGVTQVPADAQQVHIEDADSSLRLEPATVRAGDVYVVLDGPGQSVLFVARDPTAEATPGPMSDDDLDRLSRGDTQATSIEAISVGCSAEQRAAARGKVGYCGNVYKLVLVPGKYAFLLDSPDSDPPQPVRPGSMAILEVTP